MLDDTSERRGRGGGEAALGIKRQQFHPKGSRSPASVAKALRRQAAADQRQAAKLYKAFVAQAVAAGADEEAVAGLAGRGTTMCGWTQIKDVETELLRVRRPDRLHAYLTGRQMCGLRWVCPICTAARAELDRTWVNDGLAAAREAGLVPVMMTLTTRHDRFDRPAALLAAISRAEQKLKRLKVWQRLAPRVVGYVRVLEWTWSEKHGHHPHFHLVLLVRADSEEGAVAAVETLRPAYMRQLAAAGRDGKSEAAWKHSMQVQGAAAAANYVTKWGLAEEMTGSQKKDGGGLTPWQLLRLSRTESAPKGPVFGAVWWEIIQATKGKAQLYKSEGWTDLVEAWRSRQPEPEPAPEPEKVTGFGKRPERPGAASPLWEYARWRTLAIREAAESTLDLNAAREAVAVALRACVTDADLEREDDPGDLVETDADPPVTVS